MDDWVLIRIAMYCDEPTLKNMAKVSKQMKIVCIEREKCLKHKLPLWMWFDFKNPIRDKCADDFGAKCILDKLPELDAVLSTTYRGLELLPPKKSNYQPKWISTDDNIMSGCIVYFDENLFVFYETSKEFKSFCLDTNHRNSFQKFGKTYKVSNNFKGILDEFPFNEFASEHRKLLFCAIQQFGYRFRQTISLKSRFKISNFEIWTKFFKHRIHFYDDEQNELCCKIQINLPHVILRVHPCTFTSFIISFVSSKGVRFRLYQYEYDHSVGICQCKVNFEKVCIFEKFTKFKIDERFATKREMRNFYRDNQY